MKKILVYGVLCPIIFITSVQTAHERLDRPDPLALALQSSSLQSNRQAASILDQATGLNQFANTNSIDTESFSVGHYSGKGTVKEVRLNTSEDLAVLENKFASVAESIFAQKKSAFNLLCEHNIALEAAPAVVALGGAGTLAKEFYLTRAIDGGAIVNSVIFLTLFCGAAYVLKSAVYDQMNVIVSYKADVDNLCAVIKQLQDEELPAIQEQNVDLKRRLLAQDLIIQTIQAAVTRINQADEKILQFHAGLIEELRKVQVFCQEYQEMKAEKERYDAYPVVAPFVPVASSSEYVVVDHPHDLAASVGQQGQQVQEISAEEKEKCIKKKHSALSHLRKQLFGSKHEDKKYGVDNS